MKLSGPDGKAIHDDTDGEINALTLKATPVGADLVIIEDSAASFAKKKATLTAISAAHLHGVTEVTQTTATSTTSSTYVAVDSMSATPGAGTYMFHFSCTIKGNAQDQDIHFALFVDGTIEQKTDRHAHSMSGHIHSTQYSVMTMGKLVVGAAEVVDVRWFSSTGDTANMSERSLCYWEVIA